MQKIIVKATKADIENQLVTAENVKKIVDFIGDTTWSDIDYEDTAEKILDKQTKGLGWVDYELINDGIVKPLFCTFANKEDGGEAIDLGKKDIKKLHKKFGVPVFTFEEILNGIGGTSEDEVNDSDEAVETIEAEKSEAKGPGFIIIVA